MSSAAVSKQIIFYVLKSGDEGSRFQIACRLAQAAFQKKQRLYIHCDNESEVQYMDDLLWTFKDTSFIPHAVIGSDTTAHLPIAVGTLENRPAQYDQLLNLSAKIPPFYANFDRTLEIVPAQGDLRQIMREHYRDYQQQGCELITHEVTV
ncbi:MAG: holC [Gammaproteobacteria bacterium]|jgi:DNA polymerase-3 subunit chi|nr:holC [Gammaproteobacteria bacterium]